MLGKGVHMNRNILILALFASTSACFAPAPADIDMPEAPAEETVVETTPPDLGVVEPGDGDDDDDGGTTTDGTDGDDETDGTDGDDETDGTDGDDETDGTDDDETDPCEETTIEWIPQANTDGLDLTGATDGYLKVTSNDGQMVDDIVVGPVTSLMVIIDDCMVGPFKIEGHVYGVTNVIPDHVELGRSYIASFGSGGHWEDPEETIWQCDVVYGGTVIVDSDDQSLSDSLTLTGSDSDGDGSPECTDGDSVHLEYDTVAPQ
jgi:hypothetical protein